MLFREFKIIAAAAYAAEEAANGYERPAWDELSETEQNQHMQRVMAIARGESELDAGDDLDQPESFEAVARAILGHNNGQGALALEEIAQLGGGLIDLGLVTEEEAQKGGSIIGHAMGLLAEYAASKDQPVPYGPPDCFDDCFDNPRYRALFLAVSYAPREAASIVDAFADFCTNERGFDFEAYQLLELGCQAARAEEFFDAERAVQLAHDFRAAIHPPTPAPAEPGLAAAE